MFNIEAIVLGCLIPSAYSAYTDATKRYLYDYITVPMFLLGVIYSVYTGIWINTVPTTLVVFLVLMIMALKGGISGGDVKFTTAITIWFGYPWILYILLLGSLLALIFGVINLNRLGVLKKRMVPFINGLLYRFLYGINVIPKNKLPEGEEISEEAVPFGTFLAIATWGVFLMMYLGGIK